MVLSRPARHVVLTLTVLGSIYVSFQAWGLLAVFLHKSPELLSSFSLSDRTSSHWFILHPLLAILGTVMLPVPAVLLRKYKGYWSKKIHAYVFVVAMLATALSCYVIYAQKEVRGKPHLSSWHAIAGACLGLGYAGIALAGLLALDPDYAILHGKRVKATLKWVHKSGGRLLLVGGYLVCFSGWYKFFDAGSELWGGVLVTFTASLLTYLDPLWSRKDSKRE